MLSTSNNETVESSEDDSSDMLQRTGTFNNQAMMPTYSQGKSSGNRESFYTALTSEAPRQKSLQKPTQKSRTSQALPKEVQIMIDDIGAMQPEHSGERSTFAKSSNDVFLCRTTEQNKVIALKKQGSILVNDSQKAN